jgi:hypothetical protein
MAALKWKRIKRHDPQAGYSIQVSNEKPDNLLGERKKKYFHIL